MRTAVFLGALMIAGELHSIHPTGIEDISASTYEFLGWVSVVFIAMDIIDFFREKK